MTECMVVVEQAAGAERRGNGAKVRLRSSGGGTREDRGQGLGTAYDRGQKDRAVITSILGCLHHTVARRLDKRQSGLADNPPIRRHGSRFRQSLSRPQISRSRYVCHNSTGLYVSLEKRWTVRNVSEEKGFYRSPAGLKIKAACRNSAFLRPPIKWK